MPFGSGSGSIRPLLSLPLVINPRDYDKFYQVLGDLRRQNPILKITLRVRPAPDSSIIRLEAQSESQLTDLAHRLRHEYAVDLDTGPLAVIYIEAIRKSAEAEGKYIRQTGGKGNYGHVKIRLEPVASGSGFSFINQIRGGVVPRQYIDPIRMGIETAAEGGILAGCEMVDFKATLFDGSFHEADSNEMAFRIAGSLAFREAARKASPVLLEPVMAIEVTTPEERMRTSIADINARRGRIEGMQHVGGSQVIKAMVPLKEILGYADDLQSSTQRRATCTVQFARYEEAHRGGLPGQNETGIPVTRPQGPGPRADASAVDPEPDWT
jgi:elongation factor G